MKSMLRTAAFLKQAVKDSSIYIVLFNKDAPVYHAWNLGISFKVLVQKDTHCLLNLEWTRQSIHRNFTTVYL